MRRRLPSGLSLSATVSISLAVALGALAFGCGSTVVVDGDGTGTGSGAAPPDDGWTDDLTDGTSSSSSSGVCQSYFDQGAAETVTIHIVNHTQQTIYLPADCGSTIDYQIDPASGPDGLSYGPFGNCLQTCEDLQTQSMILCGACAPSVYALASNASVDVPWAGLALAYNIDMPAECWFDPNAGTSCAQLVMATMQTYSISMSGYAECAGDCACSDDGFCNGPPDGQMAEADQATFDLSSGVVEVVFDSCAFGCPAD